MIKKGLSMASLPAAVVVLIIIGLVASIGTSMNTSFEDTRGYEDRIVNETITGWANESYQPLSYRYVSSITLIGNDTLNITSGNYTLVANKSASGISMNYTNTANDADFVTGDYWVQYVANAEKDAYLATKNSTAGILEVTGNLTLLGLIVVMGAVITVLLASFGGFIGGSSGGL